MSDTQASIDAQLKELQARSGERVTFRRVIDDDMVLYMTIYPGKLTSEQKQRLREIEEQLFELADSVTREETHVLKGSPK